MRGLVRDPSSRDVLDLQASGLEPVQGDVLDRDSFVRAAKGVDVIFHTVAVITKSGGWELYRQLNVDGTENAIAATEASGARLLQLSSVAVYGPEGRFRDDGRKTDEDTPLTPLPDAAYYARSKRDSERLVMDAHDAGRIWATAVRPDVIYGPRDRQFVPRIARLLSSGFAPLIGGGRSTLPIVHAANVADGAVRAVMNERRGRTGVQSRERLRSHRATVLRARRARTRTTRPIRSDSTRRRARRIQRLSEGREGAERRSAQRRVECLDLIHLRRQSVHVGPRAPRDRLVAARRSTNTAVPEAFHSWLTNQR